MFSNKFKMGKGLFKILMLNSLLCFFVTEALSEQKKGYVFEESPDSVVSIEAEHFFNSNAVANTNWKVIPHFGKTLSAVTLLPTRVDPKGSKLEYKMKINTKVSQVKVNVLLSTTLNFDGHEGMFYNISFDDILPEKVNINGGVTEWQISNWQKNRINIKTTNLSFGETSDNIHVLKFEPLSPGIVIQKIVIDCGGLKYSYLGPPESGYFLKNK